ncbi:CNNM domain-containing protein [Arsukibacterium sp. UBA4203]|uniref:CNNM domain-containing protein n=1 Tax=Arsukibacterium sp. UBA4203 TaxID=1946060 RepID=UPI0039C884A8
MVWGVPEWAAGGASFAFALFVVTFLHLVVGEMAPKSLAIAHPERSSQAFSSKSPVLLISVPCRSKSW